MLHFHIITFFIPVMSQVYLLFVVLVSLKKRKMKKFTVLVISKRTEGKVFKVACVEGRRVLERFQKYFCDARFTWSKYFTYDHTGRVVYTSCGTLLEPSHWMWLWWLTCNFTLHVGSFERNLAKFHESNQFFFFKFSYFL